MLRGFDASSVQGKLPYDGLDVDLRFVILKAQQGNDGFDPMFGTNLRGALAVGLEPFAYCFVYPLPHLDPKAQAKLFVERVYKYPEMAGRPLFLDCEWPEPGPGWAKWSCFAKQISEFLRDLFEEVTQLSGKAPILYTYPWWWASVAKDADVSWAAKYALWMADYNSKGWPSEVARPKIPAPWTDWLFWQFDGNGGLKLQNGVDADFCVFNGDDAALAALTM